MSFLGIDIGTSFIKGAVLYPEVHQLGHIKRFRFPDAIHTGNPLHCEYDPREIVKAVKSLIHELAPHVPDCEGLVMCSQMHGLLLMNDKNEPMSNCITWQDQRAMMPHPSGGGTYYDVLMRRISREVCKEVGNELKPARPICFLFWLAENGMIEPGLIPASLPDFILSTLCGSNPGVETTNASAYGGLNLRTFDWHHGLIRELGLDHLRWPTLRKNGEVVGYLELGSRTVPCFTPVGDAQAALAGALLTPEELSLNISTGSQISRLTARLDLGDYQTRPYFDGIFLNTNADTPAGRSLDVLVDLLTELTSAHRMSAETAWNYIAGETEKVPDTGLEFDLNFFPEPGEDYGKIAGIRGDNLTIGHLFRAAFKNMADRYYSAALQLWPDRSWHKLLFSGGLALKLETLRETIQKKFGTEYRVAPYAEDTLYGLLILATVFSGRARSVEEVTRRLRPRISNLPA